LDHAAEAIERNARMLSRLVDDVLDRSRIATGTLRLDRQVVRLGAIVRSAVDQVRPRLDSNRLQCTMNIPLEDCEVLADPVRLQQVFTNLLSNAVKFTTTGGRITVSMTVNDADAEVSLLDTGCGIPQEMLPHIFEPFRQGREKLGHGSQEGLGLGLSIVRYFVERHDGSVRAESDGPGLGSRFTVMLPLARPRNRALRSSPPTGQGRPYARSIH
jgi:two-component system CheB/CheR fusion protein